MFFINILKGITSPSTNPSFKKNLFFILCLLLATAQFSFGQSLDFQNTPYYTASGQTLTSGGETLASFDFSSADADHPLLNDGVYFQVVDYLDHNLWIRVRHIAADPNGTSIGHNISATTSSPFRDNGFGGWTGFLYQFDIYKDASLSGSYSNTLDGTFKTAIKVESIETLSEPEWVSFKILDNVNSEWVLNSIDFTGSNPNSNPGFSGIIVPYDSPDFSADFPTGSNTICVVDFSGGGFSEFSMSANSVSQFTYGYEYGGGGYQGMRLYFGTPPLLPVITSFSPGQGSAGEQVIITGLNFDPIAENNTVMFNGVIAVVVASTTTSITVIVPEDATTGIITVTVGNEETTSATPFTILEGIKIYNAISANDDVQNSILRIENIEAVAETRKNKVQIFNRWGDEVFSVADYNNVDKAFSGKSNNGNLLPAGIYFYKIKFNNGKERTGFLSLKY